MQTVPNVLQELLEVKVALERISAYLNQPEIQPTTWDISSQRIAFQHATVDWPKAENVEEPVGAPAFALKGVDLSIPENRFTLVCGPLGSGKTLFVSVQEKLVLIAATRTSG